MIINYEKLSLIALGNITQYKWAKLMCLFLKSTYVSCIDASVKLNLESLF